MNRKQRALTVFALIAFVVICACRFMLGVIYAGLFFLLADRKEKKP